MEDNNIKDFRILYNKLDKLLGSKTKIQRHGSFIQKLNQFIKDAPSFSWLLEEIRLIHDLRNVIIHEEKYKQDIAIPTNSFIHKLKQIIRTIENPQLAMDIASKNAFVCEPNDKISDIVKVMAEKFYSIVPVYEDKNSFSNFIGVFTERSLLTLVAKNINTTGTFQLDNVHKIDDIIDTIKSPIRESWDFISSDLDVYKVQDLFHTKTFSDAAIEKSRLGVLFITENGNKNEELLGVITSWDLSKIVQYPKTI